MECGMCSRDPLEKGDVEVRPSLLAEALSWKQYCRSKSPQREEIPIWFLGCQGMTFVGIKTVVC